MLTIVNYPNPVLSQRTERVNKFDDSLKDFIAAMHATMFTANGIGLAANQVGDRRRMFVAYDPETLKFYTFVNPKIIDTNGSTKMDEGCLSFPGQAVSLNRPATVFIKAQDSSGKYFKMNAKGILARCILHEMDHLNGVTMVDRRNGDGDPYPKGNKDYKPRKRSS